MPIFDFKCKKCGDVKEQFMFGSEEPEPCSKCGSVELQKQLSCPGSVICPWESFKPLKESRPKSYVPTSLKERKTHAG